MKLSYEARIGILATITLIILVVGYKFLKGNNLFDNHKTYYAIYDNVGQLDPSAPVFTRGIKVGTVLKVELAEDNPDKVLVTMDVKGNIRLPKNTLAVLLSTGLLGGKAIDLRFDHHCTDDCVPSKGMLNSEVESMLTSILPKSEIEEYMEAIGSKLKNTLDSSGKKSQFNSMSNDLGSTLHNLHLLSIKLNELIEANTKQINTTVSGLSTLSSTLSSNAKSIDQSLKNLETITSQLKNADAGKLVQNSTETLKSIEKTSQEATKSLKEIQQLISQINNGNGTLSKLIKDPTLYKNLELSTQSLEKLLTDLKANPGRYVHFSVFPDKKKNQ
ncbi:MAG: MCE family protein [Saprospiraceae bacterium]|nr:MCE family protein [Saprospiraceae bacterium]